MKTKYIILIVIAFAVLFIGGGLAIYFVSKKKNETPPEETTKETPTDFGNEFVKQMQTKLNEKLPSDYPKLVIDGIYGPKTKAAFEKVFGANATFPTTESELQKTTEKALDKTLLDNTTETVLLANPMTAPIVFIKRLFS